MGLLKKSGLLALAAVAHGSKYPTSGIQWGPCDDLEVNATAPIECADFAVPLDYTDESSDETLTLQLLKVAAPTQPALGTIQINFGGPGLPGRGSLAEAATLLLALSGGAYDLVAFDPRGTGNTLPFFCYKSDYEIFQAITEVGVRGNASEVQIGRQWARGAIDARLCKARAAETGSLLSTAFVARDMMRVAEALEDDGLLRYWGFSYGTTLGATVAAMFPDKVEKMILDGVQNPHEYYHAFGDYEEWTDSDEVFSGIFSGCVAHADSCALAQSQPDATAAELEAQAWAALEGLKTEPIALGTTYVLDYSALKGFVQNALYGMDSWPTVALVFDRLLARDEAALTELLLAGQDPDDDSEDVAAAREALATTNALFGIHCGERTVRAATYEEIRPSADKLLGISRIMGDASSTVMMTCARWEIEARERYEGGFDVRTKEPVLVIGNTYDAHTPLVSARNVSSGLEGSAVLEVNGYGHSSLSPASLCTLKTTAAYWLNGTLPEPDTVCEVEGTPFSGVTWVDVLAAAAGNSSALGARHAAAADVDVTSADRLFGGRKNGLLY